MFFLVGRLEERELELKKEYNSLHQRHTEVRRKGWRNVERCNSIKRKTLIASFPPVALRLASADDPQLHGARGEDQDAAVQRDFGVEHGRPSQVGTRVWAEVTVVLWGVDGGDRKMVMLVMRSWQKLECQASCNAVASFRYEVLSSFRPMSNFHDWHISDLQNKHE